MKFYLIFIFFIISNEATLANPIVFVGSPVLQKDPATKILNPNKRKIRWKNIFRPIRIFKKRIRFWIILFSGIILPFVAIELFNVNVDFELEGPSGVFFGGFIFLLLLSTILLVVSIPIVWTIRFFRELNWRKRFSKCSKL